MPTTTPKRLTGPMSRRLHDARVDAGLSRRALAELVGISERTVNYYEDSTYSGKRKPIVLRAWADVTGRRIEEVSGPSDRPLLRTGWLHGTADRRVAA